MSHSYMHVSNKKLGTIAGNGNFKSAVIYYSSELDEYTVKFWYAGDCNDDADYFTDSRQDAFATAHNWAMPTN